MLLSNLLKLNFEDRIGISGDFVMLLLIILIIVLIVVMILQTKHIRFLRRRYERFMSGKKAQSLEGLLTAKLDRVQEIEDLEKRNRAMIEDVQDEYDSCFRKMGLVKYDALHESAGKLSFSLALLNGRNSGYVLNAVHSSEGCYTYVKEIIDGHSVVLLSKEEKEAVEQAMKS